jgi:hypothetical protein
MSAGASITVRVPLAIRRRSGRKMVVTPGGPAAGQIPTRADPAMVKALARAFRWRRLLENGRYASISEIAAAEKIDRGYVGSILRLTLLAPDIIEAILDGRQPEGLGLPTLLKPFPLEWDRQRIKWLVAFERTPRVNAEPAAASDRNTAYAATPSTSNLGRPQALRRTYEVKQAHVGR